MLVNETLSHMQHSTAVWWQNATMTYTAATFHLLVVTLMDSLDFFDLNF